MSTKFAFSLLVMLVACSAGAQDLPRIFMTSVSGNGDLSTWPDAHGQISLNAGDGFVEHAQPWLKFRNLNHTLRFFPVVRGMHIVVSMALTDSLRPIAGNRSYPLLRAHGIEWMD